MMRRSMFISFCIPKHLLSRTERLIGAEVTAFDSKQDTERSREGANGRPHHDGLCPTLFGTDSSHPDTVGNLFQ
jgi:hypothetical protein